MPLGLPDHVNTCLFDLDGVLTQTAKVHAAAWKQMFDEYLKERARAARRAVRPVRQGDRLRRVRRRQAALRRGAVVPRVARDRAAPGHAGRPARRAETVDGLGNRKNEIVLKMIKEHGVEPYEGSVRYVQGGASTPGCTAVVVSSSTNARDVLQHAGIIDLFEDIVDGMVADRDHLKGKPAPDTFLAGREDRRRRRLAGGRVRGRARRRRGRAGRELRHRRRRRPRRSGGRAAAATAPTSSSRTSPSCWTKLRDQAPGVPGRAVGGPRDRARPRATRADRVGVRALQRPHRAAREPRRGRAVRPPGHVPERVLRDSARCRTPRPATATRRSARRSSTSPTARSSACSSRTSRSTSATASSRDTSACSTSAPGCSAHRGVGVADRRRGARHLNAAGLVHAAGDRGDPATRSSRSRRRCRSSSSRSWSPTSTMPDGRRRPARRRGARRAARVRAARRRPITGRSSSTSTRAERPADGGGDGPRDRRPGRHRDERRELHRPRPTDAHRRPRARHSRCGS